MGYAIEDYEDAMGCYANETPEYYKKKLDHAAEWFCYLTTLISSISPLPIELIEKSIEEIASALDCDIDLSSLNIQGKN